MRHKGRQSRQRQDIASPRKDNPVFSYSSKRSASERTSGRKDAPEIVRAGAKPSIWHRVPSWLAMIAIIISVGYLLTLTTTPRIIAASTGSADGLLRGSAVYKEAATTILSSSPLNRLKFTINTSGFEQAMKTEFPELSQASITLPLIGRQPVVQLEASQPVILIRSDGKTFALDSGGKAIISASDLSNLNRRQLPTIIDQSNVPVSLGKGMLTASEVTFITTLNAQLVAQKLPVDSYTLPPVANELQMRLKGLPYYVRFDMENDPKQSAGTYIALKKKLDGDGTVPSEYIDLRIDERAYYK